MIELREMAPQEFEVYFQDKLQRYTEVLSENVHEVGGNPSEQAKKQLSNLLPKGLATRYHWLFTVQVDAVLAGYVWVKIDDEKKSAFLYEIYLFEVYRGNGIGTEVMRQIEHLLRQKDITYFKLHVFGSNTGARKLYEELGFQIAGVNMLKSLDSELLKS
ncbi:GNAT family N-acetyltransferase [Chryseomicrobium aureum]|uniref:GNAT family N-acetyltransferase n=1 Tax=Chryseomicrobium aureum TaxID=1441723 RepID=UPI00370D4373